MGKLPSRHYYNGAIDPIDRPPGTTTAPRPDWCIVCKHRRPLPLVFPNWIGKLVGKLARFDTDYYWQDYCGPCDDLMGIL